jgi:hypothetical protein
MWKYEIIIYWSDEDQAYIAEVPELPGCAADGATYKQALANKVCGRLLPRWVMWCGPPDAMTLTILAMR